MWRGECWATQGGDPGGWCGTRSKDWPQTTHLVDCRVRRHSVVNSRAGTSLKSSGKISLLGHPRKGRHVSHFVFSHSSCTYTRFHAGSMSNIYTFGEFRCRWYLSPQADSFQQGCTWSSMASAVIILPDLLALLTVSSSLRWLCLYDSKMATNCHRLTSRPLHSQQK